MKRLIPVLALFFTVLLVVVNNRADAALPAAESATPLAHAKIIRGFARITFEWPRPVYLSAKSSGRQLIIDFERPANPDMGQVMQSLGPYIDRYRLEKNGRRLVIDMKEAYKVRSFVSNNINGVDILGIQGPPAEEPPVLASPAAPLEEIVVETQEVAVAPEEAPPSNPISRLLAALTPSSGEETVEAQAPEPAAEAETPGTEADAAPPDVPEESAEAVAPEVASPEEIGKELTEQATEALKEESASDTATPTDAVAPAAPVMDAPVTPPAPPEKEPAAKAKTAPIPAAPKEEKAPTPTIVIPLATEKESPPPVAEAPIVAQPQPPVAEQQPAPATSAASDAPVETPAEAAPSVPVETTPAVVTAPPETAPATLPAVADAAAPPTTPESITATAQFQGDVLQLRFPWKRRTALAAFIRGGYAWMVFNNAAPVDLSKVESVLNVSATLEKLAADKVTVLRLPVRGDAGIMAETVPDSFEWIVTLKPSKQPPKERVRVDINTDPPLKPHLFLPVLEMAEVVEIKDPDIGDQLAIVPLYVTGVGVSPPRHFVEFSLLETAQGVVVQQTADDTTLTDVRNGLRVTTELGANLTPGLPPPTVADSRQTARKQYSTHFPYEAWKPKKSAKYHQEVRKLIQDVVRHPNQSKIEAYRRAAEIHLSQGDAAEAIGYLNNVKRIDPEYFVDHKLNAMMGAAQFLLQRYGEAAQTFSVPELRDDPEIEYWKNMIAELLGTPEQLFDYRANYEPYIKHYPPLFRQRLGIIAADRAIAAKEYNGALMIFDQLNQDKLLGEIADYINYLMGKIAVETQQAEDGYKIWQKLIDGRAGEFVKVRALYSLLADKYRRGELTTEEAINQFERLGIRWRGDNVELGVLTALSGIYEEREDWPNALRIWRSLNEAFPNTVEAVDASRKMDDAFIAIFDKGEAGRMSTLDKLFLYNEHRDLVPTDDIGDRIVDNVTNMMIEMDLLEEAAKLLEQRMRFHYEHAARSKVGARLAQVYLLDKQPLRALEALQLSMYGMIPEALSEQRKYLTVQALLDLKRYQEMFDLLGEEDVSRRAELLRLEAYWRTKDWPKLIVKAEDILKQRKNPVAALSTTETGIVVKLAVAYLSQDEFAQLSYMRDYFPPLMEDKESAALVEYVTRPKVPITPATFEQAMESLNATREFLKTYRVSKVAKEVPAETTEETAAN